MSHLHTPRLCVHGTFLAEGVTANNLLAALSSVNKTDLPNADGWHNNNCASNHFWVIGEQRDVDLAVRPGKPAKYEKVTFTPDVQDLSRVVSAWDADGPATTDPVLGAAVFGMGIMADLDPEHRRVTDLCGLNLQIQSGQGTLLRGTLRTTQLRDFWTVPTPIAAPGVWGVSTVWASVLDHLKWADEQVVNQSRVLRRLRDVSGGALSVRLVLTHYGSSNLARQNTGKLLAVIGPYFAGEPQQLVPGRRLVTPGDVPPYGQSPMASFLVDEVRHKLVVDLGSLVPDTLDPGSILLTNLTAETDGTALGSPRDLTAGDWLKSAGLIEWDLTTPAQTLLANRPLHLKFMQPINGVPTARSLEEHSTGKYIDVDQRSLRLNPGTSASVAVYARQFGKPLAGEVVRFDLRQQNVVDPIRTLIPPTDPYYPKDIHPSINSEPKDIFEGSSAPFSVTTDAQGRGELQLKIKPGPFAFPKARQVINSQLYFLGDPEKWQSWGALGPPIGASCALALLVFNRETPRTAPTWADVSPILSLYARLYPFMGEFFDLANEQDVRDNADEILKRLHDPDEKHPEIKYMPVTRDLSASRRNLLISYLQSVAGTASSP